MVLSEKEKQLQVWLESNDDIMSATLFGSYAKGTQTARGGIDLAIQLGSSSSINASKKTT